MFNKLQDSVQYLHVAKDVIVIYRKHETVLI